MSDAMKRLFRWLIRRKPAPTASQRAARKVLALGMLTATAATKRRLG